ncbi:MAG: phosphopantetheine-binding protein [Pseudomonadota bacterium]|nr:phosphopantetheine-binding protein [Pseudomonadota bacterium]
MSLQKQLKKIIVEELNLEEIDISEINDDDPLFGDEGLGLDSLDAVELVVLIQKHFGVEIKDMEEGREALASISSLTDFIETRRAGVSGQ